MSKMNNNNDKNDSEKGFYILGGESDFSPVGQSNTVKKHLPWWVWLIIGVLALVTTVSLTVFFMSRTPNETPSSSSIEENNIAKDVWYNNSDAVLPSCSVVSDTLIDSIHLQIITPYNAVPELHVGAIDTADEEIVLASSAADLGADHGKIIGAFVCAGEPLSWGGGRKLGYCAIIDGNITLGVAENSPLFEQAIEQGGYFFRQYPAVDNGKMVENNPLNASFRRALCMLDGRVCIVVTPDRVLMNDFSASLVKLGVKNAIFLIGGNAEGWYRTKDGSLHQLGDKYMKGNPNINYIVFRAQ